MTRVRISFPSEFNTATSSGLDDLGGHDAVAVLAAQRSQCDDVVAAECFATAGKTCRGAPAIPTLPGCPGNAVPAICPTARRSVGSSVPSDDDHGNAQDAGSRCGRSSRPATAAGAVLAARLECTNRSRARSPALEHPGVQQNEPAITQHQDRAGEQSAAGSISGARFGSDDLLTRPSWPHVRMPGSGDTPAATSRLPLVERCPRA